MDYLKEVRDGVDRGVYAYKLSELRELAEAIIDKICEEGYEVEVEPKAGQTEIRAIKTEVL